MYLHLGSDTVAYNDDVIGIFDIENTSLGKSTKTFLSNSEKSKRIYNVSYEMPKSFIICFDNRIKKETVYISNISVSTLRKRAESNHIS